MLKGVFCSIYFYFFVAYFMLLLKSFELKYYLEAYYYRETLVLGLSNQIYIQFSKYGVLGDGF